MATINLYNFQKRLNSTKQPTGTGLTKTGEFNTPLDVLHPSITVQDPGSIITSGYNYAYITSLGRYYWIDRITALSASLCQLDMSVDVLATYKTGIGSSTQYVLRSASAVDGDINDPVYPMISGQDAITETLTSSVIPWYSSSGYSLADGWYIIGVLNSDTDAIGSNSYYCLNDIAFQSLRNTLFSSASWTGMTYAEIEQPLYKSLFNPMQYITSVKWFPIQPDTSDATNVTYLDLGFFPSIPVFTKNDSYAYKLGAKGFVKSGSSNLTLQKHPQAASRGQYLNIPPYFFRTLYIEPFGSITLDTAKMYGSTMQPVFNWWIDFVKGEIRTRITASGNYNCIVGAASAQLGVDVSLAQSAQGGIEDLAIGKSLDVARNILGPHAESDTVVGKALKAYGSAYTAPNISSIGASGSVIAGSMPPVDQCIYNIISPTDDARFGMPLLQTKQINTLSGFILTENASIQLSGACRPEQDMIINYLNGGFFYE